MQVPCSSLAITFWNGSCQPLLEINLQVLECKTNAALQRLQTFGNKWQRQRMQEAIFELGTVELLNCFLAICNFVTFFDFFWWPPNFKLGSFFQHIKMLWNCNVTDRIVDSVRFRILERLYWDDRWIYFELSNVNVEKRLLLLMGCGVLYHFNGEKTHLNYSTLLVPCLPFRPRHINQNNLQNVLRESNRPRQPPPFRIISFAVRIRNLL